MDSAQLPTAEDMPVAQSSPLPPAHPTHVDSSWGERLTMNLVSYSLILVPMALVVLAARYKILPRAIQSSLLIRRFVFGKDIDVVSGDDQRMLIEERDDSTKRRYPLRGQLEPMSRRALTLAWCFAGLQLSYLVWGVLQEKIMTTKYPVDITETQQDLSKLYSSVEAGLNVSSNANLTAHSFISFHDSQFLVFLNRIVAFILAIIALVHNRPKQSQLYSSDHYSSSDAGKPKAPLYEYVYCSLSNILSSWCQYEALKYVNFPTQVLSKSCKIIPVMLLSKVMLNKKYQLFDYLCAFMLSVGMFIFLLNQPKGGSHGVTGGEREKQIVGETEGSSLHHRFQMHHISTPLISGLLILGLYLAFDSFTSNWQQSLFSRYSVTNWQMMAATNFYSILLTLTSLHQLGSLQPAFKLLASSSALVFDCLMMSIMSSIGQLFVYYTIKRFGSVIFAVIMTLRQFIAILLSCAIYGHRLTWGSSAGLMLVFGVVVYQMRRKSLSSSNSAPKAKDAGGTDSVRILFKAAAK